MNKKWMLSLLLVPTLITAGCGMNNQGDERRGTMKGSMKMSHIKMTT